MTFLKKLGQVIAKATAVVVGIEPLLPMLNRPAVTAAGAVVEDKLNQIAQAVVTAEAIGAALQLSGPQKLTAASPLVSQLVRQSSLLAGRPIANAQLFDDSIAQLTSAVVGILNSLHGDVVTAPSI